MNKKFLTIGILTFLGVYLYSKNRTNIQSLYTSITDQYGDTIDTTQTDTGSAIVDAVNEAGDYIMATLSGTRGNTAVKNVNRYLINNPQIRAFLSVIRKGEGTADASGYSRLFGGGTFSDFSKHPNITVNASGYSSTAAGAYQFLKSTWDETSALMNLPDFTPLSQDLAALGRLAYRGAVDDILAGRFTDALKKTSKEWASLPFSPYGQPVISYQTALNTFRANGGTDSNSVMV
jgi:muramidase (phage lysozyme)